MMPSTSTIFLMIFQIVTQLLATVFLMRFYMRLCLVGGKAPLASIIARITNPFTRLLNPFLPAMSRVDLSALLLAIVTLCVQIYVITRYPAESNLDLNILGIVLYALFKSIKILLDLLFFAVLVRVILSWQFTREQSPINQQLFNPLTDWILEPVRRLLPSVGMIDFSPIVVLFGLQLFERFVIDNLFKF